MKIQIDDRQESIKVNSAMTRRMARRTLTSEGRPDAEVSILFIGEEEMRSMNKQYLGKNVPTDVLAFRMADGEHPEINPSLLGDVIVSADEALIQAQARNICVNDELALYVVHGILHLLGYDDRQPAEASIMRRKQQEILKGKVNI